MKVGDLVRQASSGVTVPSGAVGLVIEEDNSQKTTPRWTIRWFHRNMLFANMPVSETTGYGYGIEVISETN